MLGSTTPSLSAQLAAERQRGFADEAAGHRRLRLLRQPHPSPRCGDLAAELSEVVLDLRPPVTSETEPAATT
jgi:hypothetical protein